MGIRGDEQDWGAGARLDFGHLGGLHAVCLRGGVDSLLQLVNLPLAPPGGHAAHLRGARVLLEAGIADLEGQRAVTELHGAELPGRRRKSRLALSFWTVLAPAAGLGRISAWIVLRGADIKAARDR